MKRFLVLSIVGVLTMIPVGALLAQDATPGADPLHPTVLVRQDAALGRYLADPAGMTLYLFSKDTTPNESACYDECATNWPPYVASEPFALPLGVDGELTLVQRTDGTTQVAYNGMPLYYFAGDETAGDTNGQAVGDVWWVVAPGMQMGATPAAGATMADLGTPAAAGEVAVTLTDYAIESSAVTFQAGLEYSFTITNDGAAVHEFLIEPAGADDEPLEANGEEAEAEDIDPGASKTLTWIFTEPGAYQLTCHVPGHYPAGMALNITVAA